MVCKCPKCDGALEYNPSYAQMECPYCGSIFSPQATMPEEQKQIESELSQSNAALEGNSWVFDAKTAETMECNVYRCTSCGGELLVNGVESSTFCAYCGQPTIVFSRVSKEYKPKYIIPFRVNKQQAMDIFRARTKEFEFAPDVVHNIKPDMIRGIYVPHFIQDFYYYFKGTYYTKYYSGDRIYLREADCFFKDTYLEASTQVNDITSQYLQPYHLQDLQPFHVSYMSGFYADKFDVSDVSNTERYIITIDHMFHRAVRKSVPEKNIHHADKESKYEIRRSDYVLLPVWFVTFRYNNEPYTMMINGQTGKIVGSLPIDNGKLFNKVVMNSLIALVPSVIASIILMIFPVYGLMLVGLILLILFAVAFAYWYQVKQQVKATKDLTAARYVAQRQEDT